MNSIRCHKQNGSPNRNDLSSFLKVVNDVEVERRAGGKLFHARGPATANARSPMDARRVDGTTRSDTRQCISTGYSHIFSLGWCYTQDGPAYNHLGYTQDSNLTNSKPNLNPNLNPLTLTVTLIRSLIRTDETHHPRKSSLFVYNIRWSIIDLHCSVYSQKWQIVQDGPANNQCVLINTILIPHCYN